MIAIWIVLALFAVGDATADLSKSAAPAAVSTTASLDAAPSETAP